MPHRNFSFNQSDDVFLNQPNSHAAAVQQSSAPPPYSDSRPATGRGSAPPTPRHQNYPVSSYNLPPLNTRQEGPQNLNHSTSNRTASTVTPGADNMGENTAGGGIAGVAFGVANTYPRESGVQAAESAATLRLPQTSAPAERAYNTRGSDTPYIPEPPGATRPALPPPDPFASPAPSRRSNPFDERNRPSPSPSPRRSLLGGASSSHSYSDGHPPPDAFANGFGYYANPYNRHSSAWDPRISQADFNPNDIDDDNDDVFAQPPNARRQSRIPLGNRGPKPAMAAGAAAGGVGGVVSSIGGFVSRKITPPGQQQGPGAGVQYGQVGAAHPGGSGTEKSEWLESETQGRRRRTWILGVLLGLLIVGGIIGGIVGGVVSTRHGNDHGTSSASNSPQKSNTGLTKDSSEIKALMNNKDLHKVFPGVDYTPFNAQYPACLTNPPSQDNITKDVAVLSQLTNTIRLYGTDCNQTDMVLQALSNLDITGIKVWLGVWLDNNQTTNNRGISAMYDIVDKYGADPFAGVIIGNEVLYRKDLSEAQLGQILADAKTNFTTKKVTLPIATSDLGDDWTADLAGKVDVVMSNVHPFFAGVTADVASGWTWDFWQQHDISLTTNTSGTKNVISEVGWPSGGGTDCGEADTCTTGSVAGIDEMNKFMSDFVCQSLANGTNFFWFEAFDEPWKVSLNTPGKEWEDKWGLMDSGRNIKPGLKIPDCGSKDVS